MEGDARCCALYLPVLLLFWSLAGPRIPAAEVEQLPSDKEPVLRVDSGGPAAFVTSLAFSPDGKTLYAWRLGQSYPRLDQERQGRV